MQDFKYDGSRASVGSSLQRRASGVVFFRSTTVLQLDRPSRSSNIATSTLPTSRLEVRSKDEKSRALHRTWTVPWFDDQGWSGVRPWDLCHRSRQGQRGRPSWTFGKNFLDFITLIDTIEGSLYFYYTFGSSTCQQTILSMIKIEKFSLSFRFPRKPVYIYICFTGIYIIY